MKKISIYLKEETEGQLRKEAAKAAVSLSEYAAQLIELGLKVKAMQQDNQRKKEEALLEKTPEYLLRILNICSEMFRIVYDEEKIANHDNGAREVLENIRSQVVDYIKEFSEKETD